MTTVEDRPAREANPAADRRGPADRLRPHPAQGGPAVRPRQGPLPRRHRAARDAARRDPALADGARPAGLDRHHRGAGPPEGARRHHRQGPRGAQPRLGADPVGRLQAVLATDKVRFQGQEVAFVVAEDRYSARDALELIDVEYEDLPVVIDARRALDPGAAVIRDDKEGQHRQPHLRLGGRRQGRDRRGLRPRRRRRQRGGRLPAGAPGADGDLRRGRRLRPDRRQADALRDHPGAARPPHAVRDGRRHPGAQDPDHSPATSAAASATRSASTRATSAPSSARSSPASR